MLTPTTAIAVLPPFRAMPELVPVQRSVFFASRFTGQVGQGVFLGALVVLAGGTDTAALGLSAVLVAMTAGTVLFGLPAGMLIDRIGAPRALILGAGLRMLAVGSAWLAVGSAEYAAVVAFLYSSASQVFSPAELALVRTLSPRGAGSTHATLVALQYGGQGLGMLVLAPLAHVLGGLLLMIGTAVATYALVLAIASLLSTRLPEVTTERTARPSLAWGDTFAYLRREQHAVYAAAVLIFAEVATKSLVVALPYYLRDDLALGPVQVGVVAGLGALGVAAGLGWSGRLLTAYHAPRAMRLALMVTVVSVFALGGLSGLLVAVAHGSQVSALAAATSSIDVGFLVAAPVAVLLGLCSSIAPVGARTLFSETAPRATQGRIFATQSAFTDLMVVAPLLAVGALTGTAGPRASMVLVATLGLLMLVTLEGTQRRRRESFAFEGAEIALQPALVTAHAGDTLEREFEATARRSPNA